MSLAMTLNKIEGITATHELFADANNVSDRLWDYEMDRETVRQHVRITLDKYRDLYTNNVWVDSNPLIWNFIDLIDEVCEKQVGYIYVYRNAQDTIDSFFATSCYRAQGSIPWEKRAKRGFIDITSPAYSDEDRYQNCAYFYKIRTERIEDCLKQIDSHRQIRVRFEDLVSQPDVMGQIVEFIAELSGLEINRIPTLRHRHRRPGRGLKHALLKLFDRN
jgi:hypothetical protein